MASGQDSQHFVEIRNATKQFETPEGKTFKALDDISLAVRGNEFITLLGPSGCGKTTLLRTISGFEELDEGQVYLDGQPMEGIPPHKRPVNTVFQSYALFPHLSVGDNVGYSLDVAGVGRKERNDRVAEALSLVSLEGMERRKPRQLSGGQQQRVALARAIISRPKLLLLDEPLSALDRGLRQAMQLELKNIQHELGISFIFVTHDQEEALTMSDRIVVMDAGQVQQIGTPTEVYDKPRTSFVARFIGESNLFEGRVAARNGDTAELETETAGPLKFKLPGALAAGTPATLLIRPEHLVIETPEAGADAEGYGRIEAKLQQTVFLGTDFQLICALPNGAPLKAIVRDSARDAAARLSAGDDVSFRYWLGSPHVIPEGSAA